ncbi:unnamed protein product [Eruca vesicaria subsp. sativa]|uniref:Phytosulfokine n=1 Tax=Eruca vesicaria subsp. sativa TaxID=29727 RepID=A0ABC8KW78_ERUVS|nr:unnamed protein product [Eruca vesicaria subsp. sativa]
MSKTNIPIAAILLLSFMVITSVARLDSALQRKLTEMETKCETEDCLVKSTSDAHLDYIYTQSPPPKLHEVKVDMKKKCKTEECLMKMKLDAHIDYIYTQKSFPPSHFKEALMKLLKCLKD